MRASQYHYCYAVQFKVKRSKTAHTLYGRNQISGIFS